MTHARKVAVLVVLAVTIAGTAVLLWQQSKAPSELVVKKVLIDVDPGAVAANVDREAVRRVAHEVLSDVRGIILNESSGTSIIRVRVEAFSQVSQGQTPQRSLSLVVDLIENNKTTARGHSTATAQGEIGPDALVGQALRDALRQVQQARAADSLGSDTLLAWLSDESADTSNSQRRRAMQALAARGEKRATPGLLRLLKSEDADIATGALQALTVLADPDAIDAIIDYSAGKPALIRKQCIDAVRATGSMRAAPWLFTLSSGHLDADVQAHAKAALVQLAPEALVQTAVAVGGETGAGTGG